MLQTPLLQIVESILKKTNRKNILFISFISSLSIYAYQQFIANANNINWNNIYEASSEITELRNYLNADSVVLYKFQNHPGLRLVQVYKNPRDKNIVIKEDEEILEQSFKQYSRFNCIIIENGAIDLDTGVSYYRFGCAIPLKRDKFILEAYFLERPRIGHDREAPYDDTILTPLFKSGLEIGEKL